MTTPLTPNLEAMTTATYLMALHERKNEVKFDERLANLTDELKFHPDVIGVILPYLRERRLGDRADKLVEDARTYFLNKEGVIPPEIDKEIASVKKPKVPRFTAPTVSVSGLSENAEKLKGLYSSTIRTLTASHLVEVIKNDQFILADFFLWELLRVLEELQVGEGILRNMEEKLSDENQMNMIVGMMLKHRFSEWGWKVPLETPGGISGTAEKRTSKKGGIGQRDFEISGLGDEKITIIEALRLKKPDPETIREHSKKTLRYDPVGYDFSFLLIYAAAPNFKDFWCDYLKVIEDDFSEESKCVRGPTDISVSQSARLGIKKRIRVATTEHNYTGTERIVFHVAVDVGSRLKLGMKPTKKKLKERNE